MYDDFFFPYEKAKLWTGNMVLLSLSNFLLYASLYMMLPALPLWMVRHWYCSYAEAGAAVAVFGLAMFLPGAFNSYLIDTFKRKSVCLVAMLLFVASSLLYPYVATVGFIALVLLNKNRMPFEPLDAELISYQDKEAALTRRLRGEELPLPAEAPEALGRIILKACEADKDKRYQSASQMQENLDRCSCQCQEGTAHYHYAGRASRCTAFL